MRPRYLRVLGLLSLLFSFLCVPVQAEEGRVLRVAFDKDLPPFSSVDENGNPAGFNIDLFRELAEIRGYEAVYLPMNWEDAIQQLQQGKIDVVLGMQYTSAGDSVFDFSESYFTMSEVLIVPKTDESIFNLHDLKEKVVSVQRGDAGIELLENVRRVKTVVSFSQPEALELLFMERADAFIGNRWTAEFYLKKKNLQDKYITRTGMINPSDYAFAVREGNYRLQNELNLGLAELHRTGTYGRLYSHYFEPYSLHVIGGWRKLVYGLLTVTGLVLSVLVLIFLWNQRLKAEVRRHTSALADNLAYQKQVMDNVDNGIISVSPEGKTTLINDVASDLLAIQADVLGTPISQYFPQFPINEALEKGEPKKHHGELRLQDGSGRILHYYMAPLTNGTGDFTGWIISLQDRTEQKHLQARLITQEKMRALGQLVAGIAHELRNPLTAIKTFSELLPKKLDDSRFRAELVQHVPEEVERMNRIVEDLLDYAREKTIQTQWENLTEIIQSVLRLFDKKIKSENIRVAANLPSKIQVLGDRGRIKQVVINLIMNAIEAMGNSSEKHLTIHAQIKEEAVLLFITDTGEGMEEPVLRHLFEPFYTTKTQGVGLGLYISQKIMAEHGGHIEAISRKGNGSTFILHFGKKEGEHDERIDHR
ncbi:transporter substrate-binding domain-containing protein [Effusibacillus consociatus]|uniref:histidine kinase n=1 Tax=Effusibacillus consociatus TaxID=1117041 RepID=A0ABV9PXP0_9BACL